MEQYAIGAFNLAIVIGLYLYIQKREDRQSDRMQEIEKDMSALKTNYLDRFERVHTQAAETERRITEHIDRRILETEANIRESYHRNTGEVNKVLLSIQDKLMQITERPK
jgi:uncharacterized protein HemX